MKSKSKPEVESHTVFVCVHCDSEFYSTGDLTKCKCGISSCTEVNGRVKATTGALRKKGIKYAR